MWPSGTALRQRGGLTIAVLTLPLLVACGESRDEAEPPSSGPFAPEGTVAMMVPAGPGGGSDLVTRTFADFYRGLSGGDVVVENYEDNQMAVRLGERAGDPNNVASTSAGEAYIRPIDLGLPSWREFTMLAIVGEDRQFIVVPDGSEFRTFDDLLAAAKQRTLTVGQSSARGVNTVAVAQLEQATGVSFEPVVFSSGGEQTVAVLAGDVDFAVMEPSEFLSYLESGEMRALLSMSAERDSSPALADIPAGPDVGLGDVEFISQFRGFLGSADISDAARDYWVDAIRQWTESPSFEEYRQSTSISPVFLAGADAEEYLENAEQAFRAFAGQP